MPEHGLRPGPGALGPARRACLCLTGPPGALGNDHLMDDVTGARVS